jgi:hypothetical protein
MLADPLSHRDPEATTMTAACKLFLTYRSEYLVLGDLCVGVRDRATGHWVALHAGTCAHLLGPTLEANGPPTRQLAAPRVGERLSLFAQARQVVSGPVVAIERPSEELLREADRRWQQVFRPRDPRDSVLSLHVPTT